MSDGQDGMKEVDPVAVRHPSESRRLQQQAGHAQGGSANMSARTRVGDMIDVRVGCYDY